MPETGVIAVGWLDVVLASGFVLVAGGVSVALRLGLVKDLTVATVRTYLQLGLLGLVLKWVFTVDEPLIVVGLLFVMILTAAQVIVSRAKGAPSRLRILGSTALTMTVVGVVITFIVTGAIVGVEPWYEPRYVLPIAGMVIGNSMNGIALALERVFADLEARRDEVLMLTALGAGPWESAQASVRSSVKAGMIPIINSMAAAGLVFIPGMMTGQVLAGVDPVQATGYQIVVMLMIAAATGLGTIGAVMLAYRTAFDEEGVYRART